MVKCLLEKTREMSTSNAWGSTALTASCYIIVWLISIISIYKSVVTCQSYTLMWLVVFKGCGSIVVHDRFPFAASHHPELQWPTWHCMRPLAEFLLFWDRRPAAVEGPLPTTAACLSSIPVCGLWSENAKQRLPLCCQLCGCMCNEWKHSWLPSTADLVRSTVQQNSGQCWQTCCGFYSNETGRQQ